MKIKTYVLLAFFCGFRVSAQSISPGEDSQRAQAASVGFPLRKVGDRFYNCLTDSNWQTLPRDFSFGFVFTGRIDLIDSNYIVCEISEDDPLQDIHNEDGYICIRNYLGRAKAVEDDFLHDCRALRVGRTNVGGVSMPLFDCGLPYIPSPPSPKEIAAAKSAAEAKKVVNSAQDVKWLASQAASGDAISQYLLGIRYRDGDGVARDARRARVWLAKAAAQGDKDASAALQNLPPN